MDLNIRFKTLKLQPESIGKTSAHVDTGNYFLNRTSVVQKIRAKIDNEIASNYKALHKKLNNFQNQKTTKRIVQNLFQVFIR
jgi:agmatine/peptidylarginine deiminase